jgi:hypothetical protein
VGHSVDLSQLQDVVNRLATPQTLLAAGPLGGAMILRMVMGKSKAMNLLTAGAGAWFAVKELSGPMLGLMNDQFGFLQSMIGGR